MYVYSTYRRNKFINKDYNMEKSYQSDNTPQYTSLIHHHHTILYGVVVMYEWGVFATFVTVADLHFHCFDFISFV